MSVIQMSDYSARQGLKTGRFLESCDHCANVHNDYGTHWPSCAECSEVCCPDCTQPGTLKDNDGKTEAICRRCAEELQQEEAAQTCDYCHQRQTYSCLLVKEDTGGGWCDSLACKACAPGAWRRFWQDEQRGGD
jgi:hypothetical protein